MDTQASKPLAESYALFLLRKGTANQQKFAKMTLINYYDYQPDYIPGYDDGSEPKEYNQSENI